MGLRKYEYYRNDSGVLYCGDCLDIMPKLEKVDLVLTDPPYGTTACKWDSIIPLKPMWDQLNRLIKKNSAIIMIAGQPFTTKLISSNIDIFKYEWIWEKDKPSNFALANKQPMKYHENIIVFNNHDYYPIKWKGEKPVNKSATYGRTPSDIINRHIVSNKQNGGNILRFPKSIHKCNVVNNATAEKTIHSTQKPVELMKYLIKTYTNDGEIVLDFAAGSGTTGVACKRLNRKWIMIEKEEKYCEIAIERIKNG